MSNIIPIKRPRPNPGKPINLHALGFLPQKPEVIRKQFAEVDAREMAIYSPKAHVIFGGTAP